nr:MAG TPA: hypothetical protein [Caudoviricetes sp.]
MRFKNLIKVGEHISLKVLASILSKIWIIIFVHYSKELKLSNVCISKS